MKPCLWFLTSRQALKIKYFFSQLQHQNHVAMVATMSLDKCYDQSSRIPFNLFGRTLPYYIARLEVKNIYFAIQQGSVVPVSNLSLS